MVNIRDYFILAVILLAVAVTGYIQVSRLLVRVSERTVAQVRVRR